MSTNLDGEVQRFSYHRAVAPMMWVLVGLACCELIVVHLLVASWSKTAAAILSLLTIATITWLVRAIAAMRDRPVLLEQGMLIMQAGRLKRAVVAIDNVESVLTAWDNELLKRRSTLNMALIAHPNVVVGLREPLPGRREIRHIAHRFDDPASFALAIRASRGTS